MKKLPLVARIVLGLVFFVFGLNGFLHFIPLPPPQGDAGTFFNAMVVSKYLLPLNAGVQTLCGALLLAGRFVPLALTLLAPVLVNIIGFHAMLAPEPQGFMVPIIALVCEVYLAWTYRDAFRPMLQPKVEPAAA